MSWNKNTLISTHTITQQMIDDIAAMGPRGHEFLELAGGGSVPAADSLVPVDSNLAEVLLARGPRAVEMAKQLTGYYTP